MNAAWYYDWENAIMRSGVKLLGCLVTGENEALVLGGILLPKFSSLAVERTRADHCQHTNSYELLTSQNRPKYTYLFGSPNRLCKLNKTVPML